MGDRLRVAAGLAVAAGIAVFNGGGCGGGGSGDARRTDAAASVASLIATIDPGDPAMAAAPGYAGSAACVACHAGTFQDHEATAHHRGLRSPRRPGVNGLAVAADLDGDGRDDFLEGLDLATLPAFAAFGATAPRLAFVAGDPFPYKVDIGGARYEVARVYGGRLREDYLFRFGRSYYLAPFEYDTGSRTYSALETDAWYAGTSPRFAGPAAAAAGMDRSASFERRCAACHTSGFQVSFDVPSGEWLTGYTELGVGCESCHGPGADHVATGGDAARILNPRRLADGTAVGGVRANAVCASCHTRGTGPVLAGSPAPLGYAWSTAAGGFRPGDDLPPFLTPTADPADYWGRKDNYLAVVPTPADPSDDSYVAAKGAWMEGIEHSAGAHDPARPGAALCFDCHDPHARNNASQIATRSPLAPGAQTSAEDGSLCLACHAGRAPFADVTAADVAAFTDHRPSGVQVSVSAHLRDSGMMIEDEDFDPRGSGVGRCTTCHMPRTVTDRRPPGTDPDGFPQGGTGAGSHGCLVLWPTVSERHGATNSCNGCHPTEGGDPIAAILEDWRKDGSDGDGVFHGNTPLPQHLGLLNAPSGQGLRCARCHTTPGFREIAVNGDASGLSQDEPRLAALIRRSVRLDEGLTCASCHGRDAAGSFSSELKPLRVPRAQICGSCHFGAGITFASYDAYGQDPHYPQQEMLDGTAGEPPPPGLGYTNTPHSFLAEGCVQCHFDPDDAGARRHTFEPAVSSCAVCHPGLTTINRLSFSDYDGDGAVEGIQDEVKGLLAVLRAAVLAGDPAVTFDGKDFFRGGQRGIPGASLARKRAAYNYEVVARDGSFGVHNGPRTIRLLQQSYRALTGADVPAAVLR